LATVSCPNAILLLLELGLNVSLIHEPSFKSRLCNAKDASLQSSDNDALSVGLVKLAKMCDRHNTQLALLNAALARQTRLASGATFGCEGLV
jgi:hypothetical protein